MCDDLILSNMVDTDIMTGDVITFPHNSFGVFDKNIIARVEYDWSKKMFKFPQCGSVMFLVVSCDEYWMCLLCDCNVFHTNRKIMPLDYNIVSRILEDASK